MTLNFNRPPASAESVYLSMKKPFTAYTSLTASLALPPGYKYAVMWGLAADLCDEYKVPLTERLKIEENALKGKKAIERYNLNNQLERITSLEVSGMSEIGIGGSGFDIDRGE